MKTHVCVVTLMVLITTGCQDTFSPSKQSRIETLKKDNSELRYQLEQTQKANQQLTRQIQILNNLDEEKKLKALPVVKEIEITRYTNFYDKDDDGKKETLIVYVQPIDSDGDIIKAAGSIEIQLWDLNTDSDNALLQTWNIEGAELKKHWVAGLLSNNYRFTFDTADMVHDTNVPMTVKVTFVDHLTGNVLQQQHLIKPL